jgi:hypothetical protein
MSELRTEKGLEDNGIAVADMPGTGGCRGGMDDDN